MNPKKKEKLIWMTLGALFSAVPVLAIGCCCLTPPCAPPPPPPPVSADAAAAPPVVQPASDDAGIAADAASAAPPIALDAGPSCGTHPWSAKGHVCCKGADCCD